MTRRLSTLAAIACAGMSLAAAPEDTTPEHRLAARVEAFVDNHETDGLSVVITVGTDTLFETAAGYADPAGRALAEPDSVYRAGSLTPFLVSVLLIELHEEGKLDLDDPVSEHLEGFAVEGVTLTHLLSHSSGLPGYAAGMQVHKTPESAVVMSWLADQALLFTPGSCQAFSETDELLAGLVLEAVAGASVRERIETHLFPAFDLTDTQYDWDGPALQEQEPSSREFPGGAVELSPGVAPFAALGLCTTAQDLARLQHGLAGGRLIDVSIFEELARPRRLSDGSPAGFGLGVSHRSLADRPQISYGGGASGSQAHVSYFPETEMTIALMARGADLPLASLADELGRVVLDVASPSLEDLPLEEDEVERYCGQYVAGCIHLTIEHDGEHLVLRPSIGSRRTLWRQSELVFASADDPGVRVTFALADGAMTGLVLDEHGTRVEARRQ